jgi:regulator of sigma E protease
MGTLVMAGQLILSLSILIVLHEGGHFVPAKLFGTRVEKFYLFFDPYFSLFKFTKGETEYGIGWLPLGGYVKISGMIDESFDTEQMEQEPQPWEFRSKTAVQRLIIMLGGVTVNFVLGLLIFIGILYTWGEEYIPTENVVYGIHADTIGLSLGLMDGDKIMKIGEVPFEKVNQGLFRKEIIINQAKTLDVERDGSIEVIQLPEDVSNTLGNKANRRYPVFRLRTPFIVVKTTNGSPAGKAGIQPDDQVVAVNGVKTPYSHQLIGELQNLKGQQITLSVLRENKTKEISFKTSDEGKMGIAYKNPFDALGTKKIEYGFAESIPLGIKNGWGALTDQAKAIGQMISGKLAAKDNLGSVFSIAQAYGPIWDWRKFWTLTGTLSLILAFMNLLPIPALDGGHVMFLLYEVISGRKPNDKFMEYATIAGFFFLVILMISILGLDIWNVFIR